MMSPVVGETALSGFPTYTVPPAAGCHTATLNGCAPVSVSRPGAAATVSRAAPAAASTVCGGYSLQTGATLGKALASVKRRFSCQ